MSMKAFLGERDWVFWILVAYAKCWVQFKNMLFLVCLQLCLRLIHYKVFHFPTIHH